MSWFVCCFKSLKSISLKYNESYCSQSPKREMCLEHVPTHVRPFRCPSKKKKKTGGKEFAGSVMNSGLEPKARSKSHNQTRASPLWSLSLVAPWHRPLGPEITAKNRKSFQSWTSTHDWIITAISEINLKTTACWFMRTKKIFKRENKHNYKTSYFSFQVFKEPLLCLTLLYTHKSISDF